MKFTEYQVKNIFRKEGITIPEGKVAESVQEAVQIAEALGSEVVVKSQVQTGGRSKAGGINFSTSLDEVRQAATHLFDSEVKGEKVKHLLVEKKMPIQQECYIGIMLNSDEKNTTLIFSQTGGVDIEETARKNPDHIVKIPVDPLIGLRDFHLNRINRMAGYNPALTKSLKSIVIKLYHMYVTYDCLMLEINPLAILKDQTWMALDGKLEIDDNARYRQQDLVKIWNKESEDPIERIGREAGFVVIKLHGDVSIISNGAGIAISTLDLLKKYDMGVANILDLSGGATAEKVMRAVEVVSQDSDVKAILFNIFGGITRCDEIAQGVTDALAQSPLNMPVICRLDGTNRAEGINILKKAGMAAASDLEESVKQVADILKVSS